MPYAILLVEDDVLSQDVIRDILESRQHTVETATDGFRALELLKSGQFDVALVDYHLPEMDGYALARLMKEIIDQRGGRPKLLALTADHDGLVSRRSADNIFSAILKKPIAPSALFDALDKALASDTQRQEKSEPEMPAATRAATGPGAGVERLWRNTGLDATPLAAVFPTPTQNQREALELCFRMADLGSADIILLIDHPGPFQIDTLRSFLAEKAIPVVGLNKAHCDLVNLTFRVQDLETWSALAQEMITRKATG